MSSNLKIDNYSLITEFEKIKISEEIKIEPQRYVSRVFSKTDDKVLKKFLAIAKDWEKIALNRKVESCRRVQELDTEVTQNQLKEDSEAFEEYKKILHTFTEDVTSILEESSKESSEYKVLMLSDADKNIQGLATIALNVDKITLRTLCIAPWNLKMHGKNNEHHAEFVMVDVESALTNAIKTVTAEPLNKKVSKNKQNILFVNCLLNDTDGTMKKMSESLQNCMKNKLTKCVEVELGGVNKLENSSTFNKVCFSGHSRFFDENHKPLPIRLRTIGGYTIDKISQVVIELILQYQAEHFEFYACESANNIDTVSRKDKDNNKIVQLLFSNGSTNYVEQALKKGLDDRISTLNVIARNVFRVLQKKGYKGIISLQGLNGIGFIRKNNPEILTFSHLHNLCYKNYINKENKMNNVKDKELLESKFIEKYIYTKPDAHQIRYILKFHKN